MVREAASVAIGSRESHVPNHALTTETSRAGFNPGEPWKRARRLCIPLTESDSRYRLIAIQHGNVTACQGKIAVHHDNDNQKKANAKYQKQFENSFQSNLPRITWITPCPVSQMIPALISLRGFVRTGW